MSKFNGLTLFIAHLLAASTAMGQLGPKPADFVNPFIGTELSEIVRPGDAVPGGKSGATQPSASVPFGLVQVGPDSAKPIVSGYHFSDSAVRNFSLTHLSGPGCPNMGEMPFLPIIGPSTWGVASPSGLQKQTEVARPGLYSVQLTNGISVELTATERTAMGRFTYPASASGQDIGVLIHSGLTAMGPAVGQMRIVDSQHFVGHQTSGNFCWTHAAYDVFYALEFDHPAVKTTVNGGVAQILFKNDGSPLNMKVGLSLVSEDGARKNLEAENNASNFETIRDLAFDKWNQALSKIEAETTASGNELTVFYTALYHSLMHPNIGADVDGTYRGLNGQLFRAQHHTHYVTFSGWDIYRSQVPLLAFLFPERASEIAQSYVNSGLECGAMPKWALNSTEANVMVGDPGAIILAGFYEFGAKNFDTKYALQLIRKSSLDPAAACNQRREVPDLESYSSYGYIPFAANHFGSAATTLELNSADYASSEFARDVGDQSFSDQMSKRSRNWKNLWDPSTKSIRPKLADHSWMTPFSPASTDGYVEGNAEQYTWMIPFDLAELVVRMGGDQTVVARLDRFFTEFNAGLKAPRSYIGNEPGFGVPWTYLWAHAPARTQSTVRAMMKREFRNEPSGLAGNDDLGALSSWYVWAALGMYPVIPGQGGLAIHGPAFSKITIHRSQKADLVITAPHTEANLFVNSLKLDGTATSNPWLSVDALSRLSRLEFSMSSTEQTWGSGGVITNH